MMVNDILHTAQKWKKNLFKARNHALWNIRPSNFFIQNTDHYVKYIGPMCVFMGLYMYIQIDSKMFLWFLSVLLNHDSWKT